MKIGDKVRCSTSGVEGWVVVMPRQGQHPPLATCSTRLDERGHSAGETFHVNVDSAAVIVRAPEGWAAEPAEVPERPAAPPPIMQGDL